MTKSEQKRQKELTKRRQKEKQRKKAHALSVPFAERSPRKKIHEARRFPVHECLINQRWQEDGIAFILLSRRQPDGNLLYGTYVVDLYCLGLKDTYAEADVTPTRYQSEILSYLYRQFHAEKCPLALAHQIIYGAIDYAAPLGFMPHKDFALSQFVLEEKGTLESAAVTFGKNGKPFYVMGPYDNPERTLRQLEENVGVGNFDYVLPLDPLGADVEPYEELAIADEDADTPEWDRVDGKEAFEAKMEEWRKHDWMAWLRQTLEFPFTAIREEALDEDSWRELQGDQPFSAGRQMQVTGLSNHDDDIFGILVDVRSEGASGQVPLAELAVMPSSDKNFWPVEEYAVWLANR